MKTVLIIALDGMLDSSLTMTLDTLRTGQAFLKNTKRPTDVRLLIAGHRKKVCAGGGTQLQADLRFDEIDWEMVFQLVRVPPSHRELT